VQLGQQLDLGGRDGERLGQHLHGEHHRVPAQREADGGDPASRAEGARRPRRSVDEGIGEVLALPAVMVALQGLEITDRDPRRDVLDALDDTVGAGSSTG